MKVGIVAQYYQNETAPGISLTYKLVQFLSQNNYGVSVFCGTTGYMQASEGSGNRGLRLWSRSQDNNVEIIRSRAYSSLHKSRIGRALNLATFSISSALAVLFSPRKDLVILSSPPLFCIFTTAFVCKLRGIPFIAEIRDLWPYSLVQMQVLKNSFLIAIMSWMEKFLYKHSICIIALTEGIKAKIVEGGYPEEKIKVIKCGVDLEAIYPDAEGRLKKRKEKGWTDKKIIMYLGALGEANNIDVILRAAENLKQREDILFVLIGDGIKKEDIKQSIRSKNLANVIVLPSVAKQSVRQYLSAADICLVTLLDVEVFRGAIPTKLIDYMACGKPVLCGVKGEAEQIVNAAGCGVVFSPNDHEQLSRSITELLGDETQLSVYGESGRKYVEENHSILKMFEKYNEIFLHYKNS